MHNSPLKLLVDNGSLNAESTLNLRRVAASLSQHLGSTVYPVSVDFSDRLQADLLHDQPADSLEPFLERAIAQGQSRFDILPFIFASGGGIAAILERKLSALRKRHPGIHIRVASYLFDESMADNLGLARILAERVREQIAAHALEKPAVVLVDHGSPRVQAAYVRNFICGQLAALLEGEVGPVGAASMEKREGDHYAFNEPLLEQRLRRQPFNRGAVVVAMLFLSPGRHAGAGGDVESICQGAAEEQTGLRLFCTDLVGTHPAIIKLLEQAYRLSLPPE